MSKKILSVIAFAVAFLLTAMIPATAQTPSPGTWPKFRRDLANTGFVNQTEASGLVGNPGALWRYNTSAYILSSPSVVNLDTDAQLEVVVGSNDYRVYCFDGRQGIVEWSYATGSYVRSSPAVDDIDNDGDLEVLIGSNDGYLYCLDAASGSLEWRVDLGASVLSSPALGDFDGDGRVEVVIGSLNNTFYCIESPGVVEWSVAASAPIRCTAAVGSINLDGIPDIIFGDDDGNVYAVDGTGTTIWTATVADSVYASPVIVNADGDANDEVVVVDYSGTITIIDDNGFATRSYDLDVRVSASPSIVLDSRYSGSFLVLVGGEDGVFYSVYYWSVARRFYLLWSYTTNGPIYSSTAVGDIDGDDRLEVLFGSMDGYLYCLAIDGSLRWQYRTLGGVYSSPALADADGDGDLEVVVGSEDGCVYCIDNFVVYFIHPPWGAVVAPNVTLAWRYSPVLIDHFELNVDDTGWFSVGFTDSYQLTGLLEGRHVVDICAIDPNGNNATDTIVFDVDATPPDIDILSPANYSYVASPDVTVQWSGSDNYGIDHYEVKIDTQPWIDVGGATSYTFTGLAEGWHTAWVKAVDLVGNENQSCVVFCVDVTAPSVLITYPSNDSAINQSTITIQWVGSDNIALDYFQINIDSAGWVNVGLSTSYTVTLADGWHTVVVRAFDKAGNNDTSQVTFLIDTTPPTLQVTSGPANNTWNAGRTFHIAWSASDNIQVDHYEVSVDGGAWQDYDLQTSVNLTLLDGWHTVRIRVYDLACNKDEVLLSFGVDATPPDIVILEPPTGAYIANTNITVVWNCSDGASGISSIAIRLYNITWDSGWIDVTGANNHTFQNLTNSCNYTVVLNAIDFVGNAANATASFTIDVEAPVVDFLSPPDGSYFATSTVTVSWGASDNTLLDHYEIRIDGSNWIDVGLATSYTFGGLSEGTHTVDVAAYDVAGNVAYATVSFTVDLTSPTIGITEPTEDSYLNSTTVTVSWTASDNFGIDHYDVFLDDVYLRSTSTTSIQLTGLNEGKHIVRVVAVDYAGNNASDTVTFIVDITSPILQISAPTEGSYLATTTVVVSWVADDNTLLDHYEIRIDGGVWVDVGLATSYTFGSLPEGTHTVEVAAYDAASNVAYTTVSFTVDITPPTLSYTFPPSGGFLNSADVVVQWNATDNIGLASFALYVDGSFVTTLDANVSSYPLTGLAEGLHNVTLTVYDLANNHVSSTLFFTVDVTPPSAAFTSPEPDSYIPSSRVAVSWTASDNLEIAYYALYLDDSQVYMGLATSVTLSDLTDGQHTLRLIVVDRAGNTCEAVISFFVDTTPPTIQILEPASGATLFTHSVVVRWEGSDNLDIDHYEISIDGGVWINVGSATEYTVPLGDGVHFITIRAFDRAGNETTATVTFSVRLTTLIIGIVIAAVVALGLFLFFWRRRLFSRGEV